MNTTTTNTTNEFVIGNFVNVLNSTNKEHLYGPVEIIGIPQPGVFVLMDSRGNRSYEDINHRTIKMAGVDHQKTTTGKKVFVYKTQDGTLVNFSEVMGGSEADKVEAAENLVKQWFQETMGKLPSQNHLSDLEFMAKIHIADENIDYVFGYYIA